MSRFLIVLVASGLLFGCGSPTSPSPNEMHVRDAEMVWVDPSGTRMFVQIGLHQMHVVTLRRQATLFPRTMFRGDITSADQLVASYRAGNAIGVDVIGTAKYPDTNADIAASVVTTSVSWAGMRGVNKLRVIRDARVPGRLIDLYKHYFIMPWTTLDPGGDITSYEAFLATADDSHVYLEGEGWIVGFNAVQMRSARITWK